MRILSCWLYLLLFLGPSLAIARAAAQDNPNQDKPQPEAPPTTLPRVDHPPQKSKLSHPGNQYYQKRG